MISSSLDCINHDNLELYKPPYTKIFKLVWYIAHFLAHVTIRMSLYRLNDAKILDMTLCITNSL